MKSVPKNDDWMHSTQLMYDKIDIMADKPKAVMVNMTAYKACLQKHDDSEVAAMFSKLQSKNERSNSKHFRKSQKSRGSRCESNGRS